MSTDEEMEKEIVEKGLVYPRITNDEIELKMKGVGYSCHVVPGTTTTVVTATLTMGHIHFTLSNEIMACVDPRNFNAELGVKYGIEKATKSAKDALWAFEGYRLAHEVANTPKNAKERAGVELDELLEKSCSLKAYMCTDHYKALSTETKSLLVDQRDAMDDYSLALDTRLKAWQD